MRITSKGQITIPLFIRERMGFLPHTEVEFVIEGKKVIVQKTKDQRRRGKGIIETLRGKATVKMSTDEIMVHTRK